MSVIKHSTYGVVRLVDLGLNVQEIVCIGARAYFVFTLPLRGQLIVVTYLVLRESVSLAPAGALLANLRNEVLHLLHVLGRVVAEFGLSA